MLDICCIFFIICSSEREPKNYFGVKLQIVVDVRRSNKINSQFCAISFIPLNEPQLPNTKTTNFSFHFIFLLYVSFESTYLLLHSICFSPLSFVLLSILLWSIPFLSIAFLSSFSHSSSVISESLKKSFSPFQFSAFCKKECPKCSRMIRIFSI